MHATPIFEFPQHGNVHTMFENSQTNTLASAGTGLQDQTQGFPVGAEVTAANRSNRDCAKPRQRAKQHVLCVRARTSRNEHVLARVRNVRKPNCSEPSVHAGKLEPKTLVEFRCVQFNKILNRVLDNFERASNQRHAGQGSRSGKIRRTVRSPPFGPSRVRHYFSDSFRRSHTANHPVNL